MCRIHNQSTILRDSDWTNSRAKEFIWRLKHLEEWIWRTASEELRLKKSSWRHVIRSAGYQKRWTSEAYLARSYFTELTKDSVRSVRPRTLQPPSLQCLSLQQDKDNTNNSAEDVPLVLEWIRIKFFKGQLSNQAKDQGWRNKASNQTRWCNR